MVGGSGDGAVAIAPSGQAQDTCRSAVYLMLLGWLQGIDCAVDNAKADDFQDHCRSSGLDAEALHVTPGAAAFNIRWSRTVDCGAQVDFKTASTPLCLLLPHAQASAVRKDGGTDGFSASGSGV